MIYEITDAFSDAFSIFKLIDIKKDTKPIIVTNKKTEIENYKELYLKYFYSEYFINSKIKNKPKDFFDNANVLARHRKWFMPGLTMPALNDLGP